MKFRHYFSLKHIIFAVVLMSLMLLFAFVQSANLVKVTFDDDSLYIKTSRFNMTIGYDEIESAELVTMPDPGEKADEDAWDDDLVRTGNWENKAWGKYTICADLDTKNCIVLRLTDGQTYVFSRKSDSENEKLYEKLLTYINAN